MIKGVSNVEELPSAKDQILDTQECIKYMPQLQSYIGSQVNVDDLLVHIKAVIDKELHQTDDRSSIQYNQVVVNMAFRSYYQLLKSNNLYDRFYDQFIEDNFLRKVALNEKNFIVLQSILLTSSKLVPCSKDLLDKLLEALVLAIDSNHVSLMSILKAVNLLYKKFPNVSTDMELSLEHIYFCLQSNQMGLRDECMYLLQHICFNIKLALTYFQCVINYWPWTNRNKLFVLASILYKHTLDNLLQSTTYAKKDFFLGLRSTLNYKNLLAPSQHVVKALSGQKSEELLELSVNIVTLGNKKELQNFYSHWFLRIQQKDELFEMLQQNTKLDILTNNSHYIDDNDNSYRLILVFSIFTKQIFQLSKTHFFRLSTELMTNCFQYDSESQLLVYKFIVDNLSNVSIENCLEFVDAFFKTHSSVDNAQFRNIMLGKMPHIINYIAKIFCRLCLDRVETSLKASILNFFLHLQKDIEQGIISKVYQPKIFYLKLLEILLKSLYMETLTKNAKNCCLSHNQQLGLFLKEHGIYDNQLMTIRLMELLNDPLGYDDALNLIVCLLKTIKLQEDVINLALGLSQKACSSPDVDECNLSYLYSRAAAQNCLDMKKLSEFFTTTLGNLQENLSHFDKDPLMSCKTQGHLFGLLNVLYELTEYRPEICSPEFTKILKLIEEIQSLVIKMLNMSVLVNDDVSTAASFEDMDKSLEMLVRQSSYSGENHELCRKYLLMSFWLTLKACCDLASSMASYEVKAKTLAEESCNFLQRCLQVNVAVLTKCRHKGAIEAAGVSIGKLTKAITSCLNNNAMEYNLLHSCLEQLYQVQESNVSTTRRGAGFSIMFLHIVKNEVHRERPILKRAVENLLKLPTTIKISNTDLNCDRLEALYLHFLCVLVRDTELREAMSKYYNEIMMAAVSQIDDPEWTICNAALQLFGALVPKIVGQKQANEFEDPLLWEPSEITFSEINRKLPKACVHILNYCSAEKSSTRSIILFLEFLHKVEYIFKSPALPNNPVYSYKELMWLLLKHNSEKVRKLAAKCFVRLHEFRVELPEIMEQITKILFSVRNENFFEGLVYTLQEGILKLQHDSLHIITKPIHKQIEQQMKKNLQDSFTNCHLSFKFFTLCKLWDLLKLLDHVNLIENLKNVERLEYNSDKMFGFDLWVERIH